MYAFSPHPSTAPQPNPLTRHFYTLQCDHPPNSSYHLSPCKLITILLTILPFLFPPVTSPLPSGHHPFGLCFSESVVSLVCLFLERGDGREKRERNRLVASCPRPDTGAEPATQACALTVSRTSDLPLHRLALNPLSHTGQGSKRVFKESQQIRMDRKH